MRSYIKDLPSKTVIHTPTEALARKLCNKLHELAYKWSYGQSFDTEIHYNNGENQCYNFRDGLQSHKSFYESNGYNIVSMEDLLDFDFTEKENKITMKTTKAKVLSIWGQDGCSDFNKVLKEVLIEQVVTPENQEFTVDEKYVKRISECTEAQKRLLKSIGIEQGESSIWKRNNFNTTEKKYYYINRSTHKGFLVSSHSSSGTDLNYTYPTETMAEKECKIFLLMQLMRSWARHHNELDGFKPNWDSNQQKKYGLIVLANRIRADYFYSDNNFMFQICVASSKRASEMLEEFKTEIAEILPFL